MVRWGEVMSVIFSVDGKVTVDGKLVDWGGSDAVTKIVVGTPPGKDAEPKPTELSVALPDDFAKRYPALTHLYLWQISNLTELPQLPAGLRCLDVRGCKRLRSSPNLPVGLDTLVLADCPELPIGTDSHSVFPKLRDLSLTYCPCVSHAWIRSLLTKADSLQKIDLSGCRQLERISVWPSGAVEIRLNDCSGLSSLPPWPPQLRRVELRNASAIGKIPDLPKDIDYVDLAFTRSLKTLPNNWGSPRTMVLYGSGILEPPASEHGEHDRANVAADVRDYFGELKLTGRGQVRRCKVMILGNGDAGKTCLAMNLAGLDYRAEKERANAEGRSVSTHGVYFWDLRNVGFTVNIEGEQLPVHLHLWDFGGQEIYHNTHRLFISRGTVFVLVWSPDRQSAARGLAARSGGRYVDEPRGLQYWVDLIRRSCDHMPRIAIVCSRRSRSTSELEKQWKQELRVEDQGLCTAHYIDSWEKTGQRLELLDWLADEVGQVIATQGTIVPKYWELAQEMVESWVGEMTRNAEFSREYRTLSLSDFAKHFETFVRAAIEKNPKQLVQLSSCIRAGTFKWSDRRIRRTLNFLTRSGWIYWDASLFSGQVIVGQQWALDGLYTILDRRPGQTVIYEELCESRGRFRRSDLDKWVWHNTYTLNEQELLLSFMQLCGLCFKLHDAEGAFSDEDVYVSYEHLWSSRELRLQHEFDASLPDMNPQKTELKFSLLHKNDWQMYLMDCGRQYGSRALYSEDGVLYWTTQEQVVFISCHIDRKSGFGGDVIVQTAGPKASELAAKLVADFRTRFSDEHVPGRKRSSELMDRDNVAERPSVFISYAWNSQSSDEDYEGAADRVEQLLRDNKYVVEVSRSYDGDGVARGRDGCSVLRRDKWQCSGTSIMEFMKYGARSHRVILIHSDRYWKSVNCMYELCELWESLLEKGRSPETTVIPIELRSSGIRTQGPLNQYLEHWDQLSESENALPTRLLDAGWDLRVAVIQAKALILKVGKHLSDVKDLNLKWDPDPEHVLEQIRMRLQLATQQVKHE